jgi:hypothetical protein
MLAGVAAIIFGLALLLDLTDTRLGATLTNTSLVTGGLLFLALHLAGLGGGRRRRIGR